MCISLNFICGFHRKQQRSQIIYPRIIRASRSLRQMNSTIALVVVSAFIFIEECRILCSSFWFWAKVAAMFLPGELKSKEQNHWKNGIFMVVFKTYFVDRKSCSLQTPKVQKVTLEIRKMLRCFCLNASWETVAELEERFCLYRHLAQIRGELRNTELLLDFPPELCQIATSEEGKRKSLSYLEGWTNRFESFFNEWKPIFKTLQNLRSTF